MGGENECQNRVFLGYKRKSAPEGGRTGCTVRGHVREREEDDSTHETAKERQEGERGQEREREGTGEKHRLHWDSLFNEL